MTQTIVKLRPAGPEDAASLVDLVVIAGDGLPLRIWEPMRAGGETVHDVGVRRALRDSGSFSYVNATIAERGGAVLAASISYPIPKSVSPIDKDTPSLFVPLQQLENLVPGSWYVNVLATFEPHRNQGLGTRLLADIERRARLSGNRRLSIITSDVNPALRLYNRYGFREIARRAIAKDGWDYGGSQWILLVKALTGAAAAFEPQSVRHSAVQP